MGSLPESVFGMSHLTDIFQIVLDIGLIVFLAYLFKNRPKNHQAVEDLAHSLAKIVEETKDISAQFDANLQERQKIIQQLLFRLDQKLSEAQQVCQKIEDLQHKVPATSAAPINMVSARQSDSQEILRLARRGLDAASIAKRLQKPLGEVELILNLQRMSPDR